MTSMRWFKHRFWYVTSALTVAVALMLLRQQWFAAKARRDTTQCVSHLLKINAAMQAYVSDNDGYWPSTSHWEKLGKDGMPGCPAAGGLPTDGPPPQQNPRGYEFNYFVADKRELRFPQTTVCVCDAAPGVFILSKPKPFPDDRQTSMEQGWRRHDGRANYLLCDGHVRRLAADAVGDGGDDVQGNNGTQITFAIDYGTRQTAFQR